MGFSLVDIPSWLSPIGAIIGAIGAIIGTILSIKKIRNGRRRRFSQIQPQIEVSRSYVEIRGSTNNVKLLVVNRGVTLARNLSIEIDGWDGTEELPEAHPYEPGHNEYEVLISVQESSPLRRTDAHNTRLRLRYQDRWTNFYETTYPIRKIQIAPSFYNLQLQNEEPIFTKPKVSFTRMGTILREMNLS